MPTVDFNRTLTVPAGETAVWSTITDVATVAGWVSIVGQVEELDHLASYRAVLSDRMGPFKLGAELSLKVTQLSPPQRIGFTAEGEDRQIGSRIKVQALMALLPVGEETMVEVQGSYEVTGRVATLGASMIRTKGEKILDEFFTALAHAFE